MEPPALAPVEIICGIVDDCAISDRLEKGPLFSPDADPFFRDLDRAGQEVDLDQSPEQLLRDERWLNAARLAGRTLAAVQAALED